jgi:hypothetical protein
VCIYIILDTDRSSGKMKKNKKNDRGPAEARLPICMLSNHTKYRKEGNNELQTQKPMVRWQAGQKSGF